MLQTLSNSGKFLSSPVSFLLICLWIWNDHIGKWEFHNTITGKISDITGLIVFPFLLTALASFLVRKKELEKILFLFANLSIILLFTIINWDQEWNNWIYANCFGNQNGFADKSDLLCIPFCALANYFLYKKYSREQIDLNPKSRVLHILAIILASVAFINTSTADKKILREEDVLYPLFITRPDNRDTFKIGEEVFFIWYTEGIFKEFHIIIYPKDGQFSKRTISIQPSQLKKHLDERINKYYYIYSEEFSIPEGYYRIAVIGSKNNTWKGKKPSELFQLIEAKKCGTINLSCSDPIWIGF